MCGMCVTTVYCLHMRQQQALTIHVAHVASITAGTAGTTTFAVLSESSQHWQHHCKQLPQWNLLASLALNSTKVQ